MNAIEEVLVALVILQSLGIVFYIFLVIRARRSLKRLNRLKADVLKSRWAVAVARESAQSIPVMDVLGQHAAATEIAALKQRN